MTLPSKYRSPRSRDFRQYYFHYILLGSIAIAIYVGILNAIEKYGPAFLYGWTIENAIIFSGFVALFVGATYIPWRIYIKKYGLPANNESMIRYTIFTYALIIGILAAIAAIAILISSV